MTTKWPKGPYICHQSGSSISEVSTTSGIYPQPVGAVNTKSFKPKLFLNIPFLDSLIHS